MNLYDLADRAPMGIARLLADSTYRLRYNLSAALDDVLAWIGLNSHEDLP